MNLKLGSNALRFRITAEELDRLQDGQTLQESVIIGDASLTIVIDPTGEADRLLPAFENHTIRLLISSAKVKALVDLGRSREGLQEIYDDTEVSLQVDFRTQKRQAA